MPVLPDTFTYRLKRIKNENNWRGVAELATLGFGSKRLTPKVLATTASLTTLATSGALVGGAIAGAGLSGAAATYAAVSSVAAAYVFGACTATLEAVTTGGAILILGMLAAGVIDFCTRVVENNSYSLGDFDGGRNHTLFSNPRAVFEGLVGLGSKACGVVGSAILTPFYLVAHAILWLGYMGSLIKNFLARNKEGCINALTHLSENSREVCLEFAGLALFPLFNFLDLGVGVLRGVGRAGRAGIELATCGMFCRPSYSNSLLIDNDNGLGRI